MAYTPVSREVAEGVRDAAINVDGVAALHGGRVGEIATYLPNTRIEGVKAISREGRNGFEVHFIFDVAPGRRVQDVAQDVRSAVLGASEAEFVDVVAGDAQ